MAVASLRTSYNGRGSSITHKIKMILKSCVIIIVFSFFLVHMQQLLSVDTESKQAQAASINEAASTITGTNAGSMWSEHEIVSFLKANSSRAYFSRLFKYGGFKSGIEVGVADGRFSEHYLKDLKNISGIQWTMVEPYPNKHLKLRYEPETSNGSWKSEGLLEGVQHTFHQMLSLDKALHDQLRDESYDFIYLDGDHSYKGVKNELPLFWNKVKKGGILAGHDYCNYGEDNLPCEGCDNIPKCQSYTQYGISHGKNHGIASNQNGVVKAVQEWMMEVNNTQLTLHHTRENFTRESLTSSGMDFDLIITNTKNPSWFVVKPGTAGNN